MNTKPMPKPFPLPAELIAQIETACQSHHDAYFETMEWCREKGPENWREREACPEYQSLHAIEKPLEQAARDLIDQTLALFPWCHLWLSISETAEGVRAQIAARWKDAIHDFASEQIQEQFARDIAHFDKRGADRFSDARQMEIGKSYLSLTGKQRITTVTRKTHGGKRVFAGTELVRSASESRRGFLEINPREAAIFNRIDAAYQKTKAELGECPPCVQLQDATS